MSIISKDSVIMKMGNNLKSIKIDELLRETINENEKEVSDILRGQLRKGRMENGFLPDYSTRSQTLKDKTNYKANWPTMDLYDTGSFQEKIKAQTTNKSVVFDSTDSKTPDLLRRFGDGILDLDQKSTEEGQEVITPKLFKKFHEKITK